jgi:FkbM family methyltransferase
LNVVKLLNFIATHPLNSGRKMAAIMRFARWQVASRLLHTDIVCQWINGSRFFARTGETGLTQNIYTGLQDFADMGYVLHALRKDDLFIDVGANVGSYTLLACRAVGAEGCAFEPIPATYARLLENVRLNHLEGTVQCSNVGVGSAQGTLRFTANLNTTNHALAEGESSAASIEVPVVTLDEVLRDKNPSLIKIDVEGYETAVLQGASNTLKKPSLNSVIMELNGSGERYHHRESAILDMMRGHGFGSYSYDPFARSLKALDGKSPESGNTLFIRNVELVAERLRNSPHFTALGKTF